MPSIRELILAEFETRVSAIDGAPPYETAAGAVVFLGEAPQLSEDDPPQAMVILTDDDTIAYEKVNLLIDLPVVVGIVVKTTLVEPWRTIERGLADIKRAIEGGDRRLGLGNVHPNGIKRGPTRTFERPEGSRIVGAGITYTVPYVEGWGTP